MSFQYIVFVVFSIMVMGAALRVITSKNPVHAALFLVLAFSCSSVLWLLLEAEFLAIVLVLVYVGAVMVLFLFVVMMLDINLTAIRDGYIRYMPVAALIAFALVVQMIFVVGPQHFGLQHFVPPPPAVAAYSNTEVLGKVLYTEYLYPFEIAGAILLVAIIAAISLTMRKRPNTKTQNPSEQVRVRAEDRLRIVKVQSEAKE